MDWQPIETAPLKTPIIITDGKTVTVTILNSIGPYPKQMFGHGFGGDEWDYDFEFEQATHWMSLPAPPSS